MIIQRHPVFKKLTDMKHLTLSTLSTKVFRKVEILKLRLSFTCVNLGSDQSGPNGVCITFYTITSLVSAKIVLQNTSPIDLRMFSTSDLESDVTLLCRRQSV